METTQSGLRVTYYYSACVGIASPDATILCDPWFTDGIYDGAWFAFPKLENPIDVIGPCDCIYISHIHPDHYDPLFLRAYLERYPHARVVIGEFEPNYLSRKMTSDGIAHEVSSLFELGATRLGIFLNRQEPPTGIDSALAVCHGEHSVVNMNDNPQQGPQIEALLDFCGTVDIALLPFTGAGPYPQTYVDREDELKRLAEEKKLDFMDRYRSLADALAPKLRIPFAGQYVLGGKLAELNPFRGLADAVEITEFDENALVLADGGLGSVDTVTFAPTCVRKEKYSDAAMSARISSIAKLPMDYERWFESLPTSAMPLRRLLPKAYGNAQARSGCAYDWHLCFKLDQGWFACNASATEPSFAFVDSPESFYPRSELRVDLRYLFGLLTCVFHWNNAEVGSQYQTRRYPDEFRRELQGFLNFFHV